MARIWTQRFEFKNCINLDMARNYISQNSFSGSRLELSKTRICMRFGRHKRSHYFPLSGPDRQMHRDPVDSNFQLIFLIIKLIDT